MEPLYGILYLALSAMSTAQWVPPASLDGARPMAAEVLSIPTSPTVYFRELLQAGRLERERLLAQQPAASRNMLLAKIRQYESMDRRESDRQLRSLELRWYLGFLMRQPQTNRLQLLRDVPSARRALVESRLAYWDGFTHEVQEAILTHEMAIRMQYGFPLALQTLTNLPPLQRRKISESIARWNALPSDQQQTIYWSFQIVFELNEPPPPPNLPAEGMEAVAPGAPGDPPLPPPLMEMVNQFKQMSSQQQTDCLMNFQRFSVLPELERERFLKAAATWKQLTPAEQATLRRLVLSRTTPAPPPAPPFPPGHPLAAPGVRKATFEPHP